MANTTWSTTDKTANISLSNGNLTATVSLYYEGIRTAGGSASGKSYWEYTFTNIGGVCAIGFATQSAALAYNSNLSATVSSQGAVNVNPGGPFAPLPAFSNGGLLCIALDLNNQLFWARNGAGGQWNASGTANPATGVGGLAVSFVGAGTSAYGIAATNFAPGTVFTGNFGDSAFSGVVPAGFNVGFPGTAPISSAQARVMVLP